MGGGGGQKETRELGTSLAGLGVAEREEFIVKTGWEGLRQVWRAKLPWRCDHSNET